MIQPLGKGGAGSVYLAEHKGRRVALKRAHANDVRAMRQLRREIGALAELEHPGIVKILDAELQPEPWYVMEYVPGRTLHELVREQFDLGPDAFGSGEETWIDTLCAVEIAPPEDVTTEVTRIVGHWKPEDLAVALKRVDALCSPLAWLHARGLVHRDLKPGNILVRPDDHVVIVDFGLLARAGAERVDIDIGELRTGTVAYMAPEQIEGKLADARADLYSLGCVLTEVLTGEPPFTGQTPAAVAHAQVHVEPSPPSTRVTGIPQELDELVLGLLAKDPRDRIPFVADVRQRLARMVGRPAPDDPIYLYRSPLCGRKGLVERLGEELEGLQHEGGAVIVGGESGVGKSALVEEFARRAMLGGMQVVAGGGHARAGSLASSRYALGRLGATALAAIRDGVIDVDPGLLRVLDAIDPRFGQLADERGAPEAPDLPPDAARWWLFYAGVEVLTRLAGEHGLLVVVDDLHEADELTMGLFQRVAEDRPPGVLFLGTWRTGAQPEVWKTLRAIGARTVAVERLTADEVATMVGEMLASRTVPPGIRAIARHSGGNPLFVVELLRAALAEGQLVRDPEEGWILADLELSGTMRDAASRRLDALPSHAARVLGAAAVLGDPVDLTLLEPVSGLSEGLFLGGVATLLKEALLEEVDDGLRFVHSAVRELAAERLDRDARRQAHRVAAEALDAMPGTWPDRLGALAHHWAQAGEPEKSAAAWLGWARVCMGRYAYQEAEAAYEAVLELTEQASTRRTAWIELGEMRWYEGRVTEAREVLEHGVRSAARARDREAEGTGRLFLGRVLQALGDLEGAEAHYNRAQRIAEQLADNRLEGLVVGRQATVHHVRGHVSEARDRYEQAIALHEAAGDRRALGESLGNLAMLLDQHDDRDTRDLYQRALVIHRAVGNRRAEGHVLCNLGQVHQADGDLERASELYALSKVALEEARDRSFVAIVEANQARLAAALGDGPACREQFEHSLEVLDKLGNRQVAAKCRFTWAEIERVAFGAYDRSEALLDQAEEVLTEIGDDEYLGLIAIQFARLAIARGTDSGPAVSRAHAAAARSDAGRLVKRLEELEQDLAEPWALRHGERLDRWPEGMRRLAREA